jgi:hypothetical protein
MPKVVRNLEGRYGDLGSALVLQDGCFYVVSSTSNPNGSVETRAFPATRRGRVTSWREVAGDYGMTIEEVVAELEDVCHCGTRLHGSDHCPSCLCEQLEKDCGERP